MFILLKSILHFYNKVQADCLNTDVAIFSCLKGHTHELI